MFIQDLMYKFGNNGLAFINHTFHPARCEYDVINTEIVFFHQIAGPSFHEFPSQSVLWDGNDIRALRCR